MFETKEQEFYRDESFIPTRAAPIPDTPTRLDLDSSCNVFSNIEAFVRERKLIPEQTQGNAGKGNELVNSSACVPEKPEEIPPWLIYDKQRDRFKVDPQQLAIYLTGAENDTPIKIAKQAENRNPIIFIYQDGRYKRIGPLELKGFIKSHMPPESRTSKDVDAVYFEIITEPSNLMLEDMNSDEDLINFENDILHLSTGGTDRTLP